ncbi:hypothetical protein PUN28_004729 [Cardiocondyla obscurior]|uniref:Uncharacterized protein n=1 Tax=Cardiocondyla obscurior TaxID=286306 RepID=A0AAW2GCC9_9HYME
MEFNLQGETTLLCVEARWRSRRARDHASRCLERSRGSSRVGRYICTYTCVFPVSIKSSTEIAIEAKERPKERRKETGIEGWRTNVSLTLQRCANPYRIYLLACFREEHRCAFSSSRRLLKTLRRIYRRVA